MRGVTLWDIAEEHHTVVADDTQQSIVSAAKCLQTVRIVLVTSRAELISSFNTTSGLY